MTSRCSISIVALTLAVMATTASMVRGQAVTAQPPRQSPPCDQRQAPQQTGTAVIRGRVFAADTGKPLRRARVNVFAPELGGENRTTSTNAEGRYELKDLPAGRYTVGV